MPAGVLEQEQVGEVVVSCICTPAPSHSMALSVPMVETAPPTVALAVVLADQCSSKLSANGMAPVQCQRMVGLPAQQQISQTEVARQAVAVAEVVAELQYFTAPPPWEPLSRATRVRSEELRVVFAAMVSQWMLGYPRVCRSTLLLKHPSRCMSSRPH